MAEPRDVSAGEIRSVAVWMAVWAVLLALCVVAWTIALGGKPSPSLLLLLPLFATSVAIALGARNRSAAFGLLPDPKRPGRARPSARTLPWLITPTLLLAACLWAVCIDQHCQLSIGGK